MCWRRMHIKKVLLVKFVKNLLTVSAYKSQVTLAKHNPQTLRGRDQTKYKCKKVSLVKNCSTHSKLTR